MYVTIELGVWILVAYKGGVMLFPMSSIALVFNAILIGFLINFKTAPGRFITMFKVAKWLHLVFYIIVDVLLAVSLYLFSEFFNNYIERVVLLLSFIEIG